jgi:hypothetical protein
LRCFSLFPCGAFFRLLLSSGTKYTVPCGDFFNTYSLVGCYYLVLPTPGWHEIGRNLGTRDVSLAAGGKDEMADLRAQEAFIYFLFNVVLISYLGGVWEHHLRRAMQ